MTPELRAFADSLLDDLVRQFPLSYHPTLHWKAMRVSAGMAYYRKGAIGLSSKILDTEEKLRSTLIHEYAHLLAVHRHGTKGAGHGAAWKRAMLDLGVPPTVRHRYEVERNQPRQQVTYKCVKCGTLLQRSRRLPARRRYVHVLCGGNLKLHAIERITPAST